MPLFPIKRDDNTIIEDPYLDYPGCLECGGTPYLDEAKMAVSSIYDNTAKFRLCCETGCTCTDYRDDISEAQEAWYSMTE